MNATAFVVGLTVWKILGFVTRPRKLATTIDIKVRGAPSREALFAPSSQSLATAWCGWSLREAATSTLTSGVIADRRSPRASPCGSAG